MTLSHMSDYHSQLPEAHASRLVLHETTGLKEREKNSQRMLYIALQRNITVTLLSAELKYRQLNL